MNPELFPRSHTIQIIYDEVKFRASLNRPPLRVGMVKKLLSTNSRQQHLSYALELFRNCDDKDEIYIDIMLGAIAIRKYKSGEIIPARPPLLPN
jgi:hypothetical protein